MIIPVFLLGDLQLPESLGCTSAVEMSQVACLSCIGDIHIRGSGYAYRISLSFQADLIHLGAKYSPCMRSDENVVNAIKNDRNRENKTACCIRNDGSGCVQASNHECSVSHIFTRVSPVCMVSYA